MTTLSDKQKKTIALVVAALFIFSVVGVGLVALLRSESPDMVVAVVNDEKITKRDIDVWVSLFSVLYGPEVDDAETRQGILSQMIEEKLLLQAAQQRELQVDQDEVIVAATELWTALAVQAGGDDQLESALKKYGVGRIDVDGLVNRALTIELLYDQLVADVKTSVDEAQAYYNDNIDLFKSPSMVKARHILVESQDEADALLTALADGADFAALAEEHSIDSYSAVAGGDLGFFQRGMMDPAFEAVAFALSEGEVSEVVATLYGFHIIKLEERSEERQLTFEEVQSDVRASLDHQKSDEVFQNFLAQLVAEAVIE